MLIQTMNQLSGMHLQGSCFTFRIMCKTELGRFHYFELVQSEKDVGGIHVEAAWAFVFDEQPSLKLSDRKELNASHVWYALLV